MMLMGWRWCSVAHQYRNKGTIPPDIHTLLPTYPYNRMGQSVDDSVFSWAKLFQLKALSVHSCCSIYLNQSTAKNTKTLTLAMVLCFIISLIANVANSFHLLLAATASSTAILLLTKAIKFKGMLLQLFPH